jgi:glycosyltransferase involved in cell wall biosynthesis
MIKILVSAQMRKGTFEAKFIPLSKVDIIEKIYILRKEKGPEIPKIEYLIIPKPFNSKFLSPFFIPILLIISSFKIKPDILISYHIIPHAFYISFVGLLTGKPYIVTQTGGRIQLLCNKNPFLNFFVKIILNNAFTINVPGNQSKIYWERKGIRSEKINILHSAIDVDYFKPICDDFKFDFIYIGSLNERKRVEWIILAFKEIVSIRPNSSLVLVGSGDRKEKLDKLLKDNKLDDKVCVAGFQADVRYYLNKSKIFVIASKTEGLPVALMEAMSCEKVVIAPDVDNIPTVICNKTGFVFKSDSLNDLQSKMLLALMNFDQLSKTRKSARSIIIKNYSYSSVINKWNIIINSLNNETNKKNH